jgi:hypothetical protein
MGLEQQPDRKILRLEAQLGLGPAKDRVPGAFFRHAAARESGEPRQVRPQNLDASGLQFVFRVPAGDLGAGLLDEAQKLCPGRLLGAPKRTDAGERRLAGRHPVVQQQRVAHQVGRHAKARGIADPEPPLEVWRQPHGLS